MNIEEKAKAYDEALEKAKDFYKGYKQRDNQLYADDLETIFPELCESEDERVRKEIISFIQDHIDEINLQVSGDYDTRDKEDIALQEWCKKAIAWLEKQKEYESTDFEYVWDRTDCGALTSALDKYSEEAIINMCHAWYDKGIELERKSWVEKQGYTKKDVDDAYLEGICNTKHELEKQGEQESADKHEPKFHVGEWIVWQNKCYKVNDNGCGYELIDQNGLSTSLEYGTVDASARFYDVSKDAKDGDVLYSHEHNLLWIYKNKEECHVAINLNYTNSISFGTDIVIPSDICPATKEQRDLLFQKMKEAGYEWSEETHELKKISQRTISAEAKEALYDKPAWSEEDIRNIQDIDSILFYDKDLPEETCMRLRNWLQSLKPNKDMVEALRTEYEKGKADGIAEMKIHIDIMDKDNIDDFAYQCAYDLSKDWLYEHASWDDVQIACKLGAKWYENHHKIQWSEEDEVKINRIVACLENLNVADNDILLKDVDWLKSLRPQKQWKPTEEQMQALKDACGEHWEPDGLDSLYTLYEQLKMLTK